MGSNRLTIALAISMAVVALPSTGPAMAQVTVTHLANEGFLLEGGGKKVLVDALFSGLPGYRRVSPSTGKRLESALPPFDGIDLILATHFHDDHFSPGPVRHYLQANPRAVFVSTPNAVERLLATGSDFPGRIFAVLPPEGVREAHQFNGVEVEVLNLHHGRDRTPPVQNLGFVIRLGGRQVLHVGDTEATAAELAPLNLEKDPVSVALLPGWYLTSSGAWGEAVREAIRPRNIGAMHLAAKDAPSSYFGSDGSLQDRIQTIRRNFPDAEVFVKEMQERVY